MSSMPTVGPYLLDLTYGRAESRSGKKELLDLSNGDVPIGRSTPNNGAGFQTHLRIGITSRSFLWSRLQLSLPLVKEDKTFCRCLPK
jgi:hypothetical protein